MATQSFCGGLVRQLLPGVLISRSAWRGIELEQKQANPHWAKKPDGGYVFIKPWELLASWHLYRSGDLRPLDLRVWYACRELKSRRCTIAHPQKPRFTVQEICGLLRRGHSENQGAAVRASIRRLVKHGLVEWNERNISFAASPDELSGKGLSHFWEAFQKVINRRRRIPVPRRIVRLIAGGASRSLVGTIAGHLLTCLYSRDMGCKANGRCKASWIADVFHLSLRAVKGARAHLVDMGWLIELDAPQWQLNRWGKALAINLKWGSSIGEGMAASKIAPPGPQIAPVSAPLESNKELPTGNKNQITRATGPSGSFRLKGGKAPRLSNIQTEDLKDASRLMALFAQANEAGVLSAAEANKVRFFAAAEHALAVGTSNPPGLFAWIVRGARWSFLAQRDEDVGNRRLKEHLYGDSSVGAKMPALGIPSIPKKIRQGLSTDAKIVKTVREVCRNNGYSRKPLAILRLSRPEWTIERWRNAEDELEAFALRQLSRG